MLRHLYYAVFFSFILVFVGCEEDNLQLKEHNTSSQQIDDRNEYEYDIGQIHNDYMSRLCDSLESWSQPNGLDSTVVEQFYQEFMLEDFKTTLGGISDDSIDQIESDLGVSIDNVENWVANLSSNIPDDYQPFLNDIKSTIENQNITNAEAIDSFEQDRLYWRNQLDAETVDHTVNIAKSSYTYWNNNYNDCIHQGITTRLSDCEEDIVVADVKGVIMGAVSSGLVGAMFGPIGSSGMTATYHAIKGDCN